MLEVPPPGAGVVTDTSALPDTARSAAGTSAITSDLLMYAVATGSAFQSTVESGAKPEPFTNTCKSADPADAEEGCSELTEGLGVLGPVIAKITDGDIFTSPESPTATLAFPADATSVFESCSVIVWLALSYDEVDWRVCPSHETTSLDEKFDPEIVSIGGVEFTVAFAGVIDEMIAPFICGCITWKLAAARASPPPGAGLITVICPWPGFATSEASTVISSWPVVTL